MSNSLTYKTKEPIKDLLLAIDLLTESWNDRTKRFLVIDKTHAEPLPPVIHVESWGGGYGKCEYGGTDHYQVSAEIAELLVKVGLFRRVTGEEGMAASCAFQDRVYRMESLGGPSHDALATLYKDRREACKRLIVPGKHTKWAAAELECKSFEWEREYPEGYSEPAHFFLVFTFTSNVGEKIRVREDTHEVSSTYAA
jgi:hypothetical protein